MILTPNIATTQVVGPFATSVEYDAALAWLQAASAARLLASDIASFSGDAGARTITLTVPVRAGFIDTSKPL